MIMIAQRDGVFRTADGCMYRLERGRTTADVRHPVAAEFPDAWAPFAVHLTVSDDHDGTVPADPERDEKLEALREEIAELTETADSYRQILSTISDGLEIRGLLAGVDTSAEGWLVAAVFGALDAWRPASEADRRATIRRWARENGHEVADRGALPAAVVEAYRQAHP